MRQPRQGSRPKKMVGEPLMLSWRREQWQRACKLTHHRRKGDYPVSPPRPWNGSMHVPCSTKSHRVLLVAAPWCETQPLERWPLRAEGSEMGHDVSGLFRPFPIAVRRMIRRAYDVRRPDGVPPGAAAALRSRLEMKIEMKARGARRTNSPSRRKQIGGARYADVWPVLVGGCNIVISTSLSDESGS